MKKLFMSLLCLALALLLPTTVLAEALPVEDEVASQQTLAEFAVEEVDSNAILAGNDTPQEETPAEETPAEETPSEEQPAPEEQSPYGKPLEAKKITVKKSLKKTVYLGLPYILNVKSGIKSAKSSDSGIATVAKDGTVTLSGTGKAKITIKTQKGDKLILTLTVKPSPAPGDIKLKVKKDKATLSWSEANYATRYLVQTSSDGETWTDFKLVKNTKKSLNVTKAIAGPTWFRVVSVLGDTLGGVSETVSIFDEPITGVRVICQETTNEGPTNRMNVLWNACKGASAYEVYHTILPSEDYTLIGATTKTWYPVTRADTKLDAYRIKPVFANADLPMSEPATLWSGYQDNVLPPAKLTSSSGIILVVNKKAQVVTAYVQDTDGNYTLPLRHMICSSGKVYDRTKNGTYTLKARKGQWYRYPSGCYIRWPSIYRSGYYFHSPLYKSNKKIMTSTVQRLGTRQSLGCIRLKVLDAEWIYKNCPAGTAVYVCDGGKRDDLLKALKPKTVNVSGF